MTPAAKLTEAFGVAHPITQDGMQWRPRRVGRGHRERRCTRLRHRPDATHCTRGAGLHQSGGLEAGIWWVNTAMGLINVATVDTMISQIICEAERLASTGLRGVVGLLPRQVARADSASLARPRQQGRTR